MTNANNAANVVALKPALTGGVYVAPLATAIPTDSTTALAVAYIAAGYVDAKGVDENDGGTLTKVHAWGGDLVKVVRSDHEVTYQFRLMEILGTVANQIAYGADNVTTTAATISLGNAVAVKVNGEVLPNQVFIFDMIDGLASVRIVVPNGQVTAKGTTSYSDSGAAIYDLTITAYPDASGNNAYKYSNDGQHL